MQHCTSDIRELKEQQNRIVFAWWGMLRSKLRQRLMKDLTELNIVCSVEKECRVHSGVERKYSFVKINQIDALK